MMSRFEIAVIDENGITLLEKFIRPTIPIPTRSDEHTWDS